MDTPYQSEIVEAVRAAAKQQTPEEIAEQQKQAVDQALAKAQADLKNRELDLREREVAARERLLAAQAMNTGVTGTFAAMQAAEKIAENPAIAPVGDIVMKQAGWQAPNPGGQDPDIPTPAQAVPVQDAGGLPGDTSPLTPQSPMHPMDADLGAHQGIETLRGDGNARPSA